MKVGMRSNESSIAVSVIRTRRICALAVSNHTSINQENFHITNSERIMNNQ